MEALILAFTVSWGIRTLHEHHVDVIFVGIQMPDKRCLPRRICRATKDYL
jgi:hypothetical protein